MESLDSESMIIVNQLLQSAGDSESQALSFENVNTNQTGREMFLPSRFGEHPTSLLFKNLVNQRENLIEQV